jgi:apolipoprotein N-acyltransferase
LSAYQAGRMALCGWLYARAAQRGWPAGLTFALAFAASEIAFPLLFPWTYAATVHQVPVLLQLAELGGPILVATVLVGANLVIAEPVVAWLEQRRRTATGNQKKPLELAAERIQMRRRMARWGALVAGAIVWGMLRITQVDAAVAQAPKGHVGVVQANMSLHGKRNQKAEGLQRHVRLTTKLRRQGPLDLVVWSETAVMSALPEEQAAQQMRRVVTGRLGVPAIVGSVLYREVEGPRRYRMYNSALLSDERGVICNSCRYDKRYLLAFGEYLPFGETFPILYEWSPNSGRFSPGTSYDPLPLGEHEIAVFICYEDILPGFVNRIVNSGNPDLLVNMTNDAWFGDSAEPWIHFALAKFRAIEHRRFLVRSTNSGVSGFIDPVGRTVRHGGTFQQEAFTQEIAWLRGGTPFELLGQGPWWLVAILVFAAGFVSPGNRGAAPGDRRPTGDDGAAPGLDEDDDPDDDGDDDPDGDDPDDDGDEDEDEDDDPDDDGDDDPDAASDEDLD